MTRIPKHATPIGRISGPAGTLTVFEGRASDGYKTDYERRAAWWWEVRAGGRVRAVRRFSGSNQTQLLANWRDVAADPDLTVEFASGVLMGGVTQ